MSTYWGYRCNTCDEETDTFINHGEDTLEELVQIISLLSDNGHIRSPLITVDIPGYGYSDYSTFIDKHINHDLCLMNEYGEIKPISKIQPLNYGNIDARHPEP